MAFSVLTELGWDGERGRGAMGQGTAARGVDELEIARGVVSALSYSEPNIAKEFHVNAFRALFGQFADVGRYRFGLAAMKLVGEIETLANGFWLATPVRLVGLGVRDLVIAPIPTNRLTLELPGIRVVGLGRVMQHDPNIRLPRQSLRSWARFSTSRPVDVIAFAAGTHATRNARSEQTDRFEYFFVKTTVARSRRQCRFGWTSDLKRAATFGPGIWLCRERVAVKAYRFFLLSQSTSRGYLESPLDELPARLQYAIAHVSGTPIKYSVRSIDSSVSSIELATPLPKPEYQIARTLSSLNVRMDGVREFRTEIEHLPVLESWLQALGCERTSSNEE